MKRLLVLMQTTGPLAAPANLATIAFAQALARQTNTPFDLLVAGGPDAAQIAEAYCGYGAERVLLVSEPKLARALPQEIAQLCAAQLLQDTSTSLAGPATRFGAETLAMVAGLAALPMLSSVDAIHLEDREPCLRVNRGCRADTIRLDAERAVFCVDRFAFGRAYAAAKGSAIEPLPWSPYRPSGVVSRKALPAKSKPRDLTTARVVVAGGRALGDASTFDRLIGGLAEKLGGAKAATGAAVHCGIASNELLVGQTGERVAPDLYIAAGISGSDQHTAGFRDAKVVVAINSNPNAAIFRMADYGFVANVHQALPELIEKV